MSFGTRLGMMRRIQAGNQSHQSLDKETLNSYDPGNGHGPFSHTTSSVYLATLPSGKVTTYEYDENYRKKEDYAGTRNTRRRGHHDFHL